MNPVTTVRGLHDDERGVLSMPMIFIFLGLMLCFSFLANTSLVVSRKVETQSAADAVAYAASLQIARGMNAVTAANHLMGELHAVTIMHHSLGGDELDGKKRERKMDLDVKVLLPLSYNVARALSDLKPLQAAYNAVNKDPKVGGAIGDARVRLQRVAVWSFITHSIGGVFEKIGSVIPLIGPFINAYGKSVAVTAMIFEGKVYAEWQVLQGMEQAARATRPVKRAIESVVLPGTNAYAKAMVYAVEPKIRDAVKKIAEKNGVKAAIYPTPIPVLTSLPVVAEPKNLSKIARSQLTRASTPWVRHWRVPMMKFGEKVLFLSRFKMFYVDHTNDWTIELVKRAKKDRNLQLLVMKKTKLDADDKGKESWTKKDGSREADSLFSTIGFALEDSPKYSTSFFRNPTKDGIFAYSQAMVYNANPQKGKVSGSQQPVLGWDTLNWDTQASPIPEWVKDQYPPTCPVVNVPEPRIKLNWQAKLVPTSRLTQAAVVTSFTMPESKNHFLRMLPFLSQARTH
jgi:hypothetical protein